MPDTTRSCLEATQQTKPTLERGSLWKHIWKWLVRWCSFFSLPSIVVEVIVDQRLPFINQLVVFINQPITETNWTWVPGWIVCFCSSSEMVPPKPVRLCVHAHLALVKAVWTQVGSMSTNGLNYEVWKRFQCHGMNSLRWSDLRRGREDGKRPLPMGLEFDTSSEFHWSGIPWPRYLKCL